MTNLEILKKAFENCGYECEIEEEDEKMNVRVHLYGCNHEFIFGATFNEGVELDYVIPVLKLSFDYNESVSNEEGWFISHLMEGYIQNPEENGTWACEGMINTWKLEADGIEVEWENFSNSLEEQLDKYMESYEIEAEYGIDWDNLPKPAYGWHMFISMCAGDMCGFEGTLVDSLIEELEADEKVDKYVMHETDEDERVYLVKTTKDRVLCLNNYC